ncbi:MAG: hypothetical protein AAFN93_21535, partial [Bacteroidota bacterium]
ISLHSHTTLDLTHPVAPFHYKDTDGNQVELCCEALLDFLEGAGNQMKELAIATNPVGMAYNEYKRVKQIVNDVSEGKGFLEIAGNATGLTQLVETSEKALEGDPYASGQVTAIVATTVLTRKLSGKTGSPSPRPIGADGLAQVMPKVIYRGGRSNASAGKDLQLRPNETSVSFRESLSNPLGIDPVLRPGKPYIGVEVAKLPKESIILDGGINGNPVGHVSVKAPTEVIVNAISKEYSGKFPKK